ncbi:MAG: protein-methionine-sulfoxide reductase catalytic subunit MsrP [Gammaproteobacteria bacterium]|nr:protein-methionine-sulfoxide reductase catalytic subunit MsrP [Gammaproteobacteria bacterium]
MLIKKPFNIPDSGITEESLFLSRRQLIQSVTGLVIAGTSTGLLAAPTPAATTGRTLPNVRPSRLSTDVPPNRYEDVSTYNNFYEFGTSKEEPALYAGQMRTQPWTVQIEGEVKKTGKYALDDLLKSLVLEERIYRFRCVEAWSMVVPWVGVSLQELIKRLEPTSRAKYVEFTTLYDPAQMPGQQRAVLDWPYVEGLRIDEATHPLSILAVGMYGKVLPNQNGAPLRLIAPWKYGFKNIKSIVKIRFTETQPTTTWMRAGPNEYGFFANVNPEVDHPRWSQAKERRLGEIFKQKTLPFNGYADQVAGLYSGMDLRKYF